MKEEEAGILSQEEIDALIRGIQEGEVPVAEEPKPPEEKTPEGKPVTKFSFSSIRRMASKMRLPAFEVIHQRLASLARTDLSAALQRIVDLNFLSVDIMEFSWFLANIPVPAAFNLVSIKPLRGLFLMIFEAKLVFGIVDLLLGGLGRSGIKIEGREFTKIEQRLIKRIAELMVKNYEKAWFPIYRVTCEFIRTETHPQFVSIIPPNDLIASVNLEMDLGELTGKVYLGIPYAIIEPIRGKLQAAYQPLRLEVDVEWLKRMRERLFDVPIEITVELGKTKITGRRLLELRRGDVMKIGSKADSDEAVCYVQNIPKFRGIPGRMGSARAFKITSKLEKEEDIRKVVWSKIA